ncbi:MAG: hypothetical protein RJA81_847 [Planctomycetota bacterium]|jgi:hypothetical protein
MELGLATSLNRKDGIEDAAAVPKMTLIQLKIRAFRLYRLYVADSGNGRK